MSQWISKLLEKEQARVRKLETELNSLRSRAQILRRRVDLCQGACIDIIDLHPKSPLAKAKVIAMKALEVE